TEWTTQQMLEQLKKGTAANLVDIPTDLRTLKPMIIPWFVAAWLKLKKNQDMIKRGLEKLNFGLILNKDFQHKAMVESLKKILNNYFFWLAQPLFVCVCVFF